MAKQNNQSHILFLSSFNRLQNDEPDMIRNRVPRSGANCGDRYYQQSDEVLMQQNVQETAVKY